MFAGGSAGGDRGTAQRSAIEDHVGFNSRIAAGIDDLAAVDFGDLRGHGSLSS